MIDALSEKCCTTRTSPSRLPLVVALVASPSAVVTSVHRLLTALVVALVLKVLATTGSVKAAATTDVALHLLRVTRRQLIPLDTCKRRILRQQSSRQERLRSLRHTRVRKRLESRLAHHARAKVLVGHLLEHAITVVHLLLAVPSTLLLRLLLEQGADADATGFGTEMATQGVSSGKSSPAAPVVAVFQVAAAHKLLLARVQPLVSLSVVLTGECFTAYAADEWALICVGTKMRSEVVRPGEAFRT
jgi:hypothetical protein